jgi:hypothetical protein
MSQSLRDVIPVMNLLQEMRERHLQVICTKPHVYCKVFEDNSSALELARLPKLCPRTKHINVCYHHFRKHVQKGLIKIFPIDTKDQIACKVFEDNSSALELARLPKLCPRTKHINVCYHHFRKHVQKGLIKIFPINTKDQIADALTKALVQNDFQRHHRLMCGK